MGRVEISNPDLSHCSGANSSPILTLIHAAMLTVPHFAGTSFRSEGHMTEEVIPSQHKLGITDHDPF